MFGSNTMANNNTTGNGIFGTGNTGNTGNTMFNTNTNNTNNAPMFNTGNNTNTGNTGGTMFGIGTGGNNTTSMFNTGAANTQANSGINRNNQGALGPANSFYVNDTLAFQNSLANIKISLEQCINRISTRNLESIRLDSWNIFREKPLNKVPLKN